MSRYEQASKKLSFTRGRGTAADRWVWHRLYHTVVNSKYAQVMRCTYVISRHFVEGKKAQLVTSCLKSSQLIYKINQMKSHLEMKLSDS